MTDTASPGRGELGPNAGLVDEMYRLFQENPQGVSARWREFFADYKPAVAVPVASPAAPASSPAPPVVTEPAPVPAPAAPSAPAAPPAPAARSAPGGNGRGPVVLAG